MPKLILKGRELLARSGEPNAHRLALRTQVSYPTIERYVNRSEEIRALDLSVLASFLTLGMGLTPEEAMDLRLSDIFTFQAEE